MGKKNGKEKERGEVLILPIKQEEDIPKHTLSINMEQQKENMRELRKQV